MKHTLKIDKELFLRIAGFMCLGFLFIIYLISALHAIKEIYGHKLVKETITMISQTATALSFIFILYQYNTNASKSRDELLTKEAINIIDKINSQIKALKTGQEIKLDELKSFMKVMSNLGNDFHVYFIEINSGAFKTILRRYWQDMYLNNLSLKMKELKIKDLFMSLAGQNQDQAAIQYDIIAAKYDDNNQEYDEVTFGYNLLNDTAIGSKINSSLNDDAISFYKVYCEPLNLISYLQDPPNVEHIKDMCPIVFSIKRINS